MPDGLANWVESVWWPGLVGLVAVAVVGLAGRRRRWVLSTAMALAPVIYLAGIRSRVVEAVEALGGEAWWFAGTVAATVVVLAGALVALAAKDRAGEGLVLTGTGIGAAAGALPDVEVTIGVGALWLPFALLGPRLLTPRSSPGHRPEDRRAGPTDWLAGLAVGLVALTAGIAIADGARGRPAAALLAPVVVAPLVLTALIPAPRGLGDLAVRMGLTAAAVLVVARHAGLGDGTARPLLGSLVAVVALAGLAVVARAVLAGPDPDPPAEGLGTGLRTPRGRRG